MLTMPILSRRSRAHSPATLMLLMAIVLSPVVGERAGADTLPATDAGFVTEAGGVDLVQLLAELAGKCDVGHGLKACCWGVTSRVVSLSFITDTARNGPRPSRFGFSLRSS